MPGRSARSAARSARANVTVELVNYRRDGTPFWNALFISPVFGPDGGEPIYFFSSQLDVTRQRAVEAAWHRSRTMEAVGQLTSGIAHDFNNLLMVIAGNLDLLEKAEQRERRSRLSSRMRDAVSRAQRLTGQLLAFARRQQLEGRALDLNALLEGMGDLMRRTLGPRIRLEARLDPDPVSCFADPGQVEVALVNLLQNARDAMPDGGVVTVKTDRVRLGPDAPEVAAGELPAGDYLSLVVADTGTGMAPEVLDRATEPFFTTKHDGPGSSLGLSTVYGFMQQSRGHLLLRSQPGRGTTVRLLFPCFAARAGAQEPPRGEECVLLVDPDPATRDSTTALLESLGYSVIRAGSARDALALIEGGVKADLLLADAMDGGSGRALARDARKRRPGLRVLLAAQPGEQAAPAASGEIFPVVGKPFERAGMALRLRAALASDALSPETLGMGRPARSNAARPPQAGA
jgi:signal transduction histidine kinase/CheY-like chemotaxis protein